MLLGGKFVKPIASWGFVHRENLEDRLKSPITLIQSPVGSLLTGSLAAILEEEDSQVIWLRFGWEDFDPATCLFSLIKAFQVASENAGAETLENMRKLPGPLQGWQDLFAQLGREIEACLPESAILVLEDLQYPAQSPLTLSLLSKHFLPALPDHTKVILISQKSLPHYSLPKNPELVGPQDLKLSSTAIKRIFQPTGLISDKDCIRQAVRLMTGSPVGLIGIRMVGELLGEDYVQDVLPQHTTRAELCDQIVRDWLGTLDKEDVRALGTLLSLGYNHPDINQTQTGKGELAPSPLSQELDGGWIRPHRLWFNSIKTSLRSNPLFSAVSIQTTAHFLCQSGFYITGIKMLFSSHAFTHAADYLAQNADQMLSLGQWQLLKYWTNRLPRTILENHPQLLHASGEIKSSTGDLVGANQDFQLANEQYSRNNDITGKVNSLLALSTLATHLDDAGEVWASAYKALQIAQSAALPDLESNAELQIGILALQGGDVQNAIQHLERAAELARIARDTSMLKRIGDLHALALEHEQHQQQRKQQEQFYMAAQQAEQAHLERLQQVIRVPLDQDYPEWSSLGWLQAPLMLKLGGAVMTNGQVQNGKEGLWGKISTWLRRGIENGHYQETDKHSAEVYERLENGFHENLDQNVPEESDFPNMRNEIIPQSKDRSEAITPPLSGPNHPLDVPASIQQTDPLPSPLPATGKISDPPSPPESPVQLSPISSTQKEEPFLAVYCLGPFRVYQNDKEIIEWQSLKSRSIFKYLLTRAKTPIAKDVLMDLFWPDAGFEAARRNLHQAIYALRKTLNKENLDIQHIQFENGYYRLNPELNIWVDFEEFEKHAQAGQQFEERNEIERAIVEYGIAEGLYQGDFLVDDLYEEWCQSHRRYLQQHYLFIALRLARYYIECGEYAAASILSRRILHMDDCQEEAHRNLMICSLEQGQRHVALGQYRLCVKSLKDALNISPSAETQKLYQQIVRG